MDSLVFLIPHSNKEFPTTGSLKQWLDGELRTGNADRDPGIYQVARGRSWEPVSPGSICAFHKQRMIVGDAIVTQELQHGGSSEPSPDTGHPYEGWVMFDPESVRTFRDPIPLDEAAAASGHRLNHRMVQRITKDEYAAMLALRGLRLPS